MFMFCMDLTIYVFEEVDVNLSVCVLNLFPYVRILPDWVSISLTKLELR